MTNKPNSKLDIWNQKYGGFSVELQYRINKLVDDYAKKTHKGKCLKGEAPKLKGIIGKRYFREYNGRVYEVVQKDSEFIYDGQSYKSLSAVVKAITGTKRNGKRFFGVSS